jgi:hypothetical protein
MKNFHGIAVQNFDQLSRKSKRRANAKKNEKKNEKGDLLHFLSLKIYAIRSRAQQVKPDQSHPQTFPQISVDNLVKEKSMKNQVVAKLGCRSRTGAVLLPAAHSLLSLDG